MEGQLNVQALEALVKANEVRTRRAEDKRAIKRGELSAVAILREPPVWWLSAYVVDLLLTMDRVGRGKAARWLRFEGVSTEARVSDLTQRQRHMLALHVDVWLTKRDNVRRALDGR